MKILSVGLHANDCEYGMGGTAALLAARGHEVLFVNLKLPDFDGISKEQSLLAASLLSVQKRFLDCTNGSVYENNEKSVRALEALLVDFRPDIVFLPDPQDDDGERIACAYTVHEALFAAAVDGIAPNEVYTYERTQSQSLPHFIPDFLIHVKSVEACIEQSLLAASRSEKEGEALLKEKKVCARFRDHIRSYPSTDGLSDGFRILKYPEKGCTFLLSEALNDLFSFNGTKMYYPRFTEIFKTCTPKKQ